MVTTRKRTLGEITATQCPPRRRKIPSSPPQDPPAAAAGGGGYEKLREERIKENLDRLHKLGIFDLSLTLKQSQQQIPLSPRVPRSPSDPIKGSVPSRRSSRLKDTTTVTYVEFHVNKDEDRKRKMPVSICEGKKEEIYTDEHDKLLGTCETSWLLFVDGCGSDGKRVYDQIKGKTCHQCRQKTLGHRTHCSNCNLVQGQFCGDCLYMRYGENVLEAKMNANWICPVCRGICNCSLCRVKKGWAPTGILYKKALSLGFKSVAHYLIQTRRRGVQDSSKKPLPFIDANESKNATVESGDISKEAPCDGKSEPPSEDEHAMKETPRLGKKSSTGNEPAKISEASTDSIASRLRKRRSKA